MRLELLKSSQIAKYDLQSDHRSDTLSFTKMWELLHLIKNFQRIQL
ncbi:hypothetical protein G436_3560 [Leptospira interrogans serovar Hardjo str. Norma]|uniref:Uncharacterized protein n=1 Tax=Leptospira interrogans serovar Hardjo str. Norma TaxID=1279460 RepID=A0A0M4NM98_LEPIR|nr:hypothetical protein G436_3560 [Leptospira interrogans serovar Hardjo str. Norma]